MTCQSKCARTNTNKTYGNTLNKKCLENVMCPMQEKDERW